MEGNTKYSLSDPSYENMMHSGFLFVCFELESEEACSVLIRKNSCVPQCANRKVGTILYSIFYISSREGCHVGNWLKKKNCWKG